MNDLIEWITLSLFYKINTCIEYFHCCPGEKPMQIISRILGPIKGHFVTLEPAIMGLTHNILNCKKYKIQNLNIKCS